MSTNIQNTKDPTAWDHSSTPEFLDAYSRQSLSAETLGRFSHVRDTAIALLAASGRPVSALEVADIGCNAGTQCRLWANLGHHVHGLDINAPLIEVARQRAQEEGLEIDFDVGSATALPYPDESMDVSLLPELLEHVADWKTCLNEAIRVVKPGGLIYLSTTNWLCPRQEEFNLPMYSWYPPFLKRRYERLAISTRPEIANHATYPAVNWFSTYSLAGYLRERGFSCLDRFDLIDTEHRGMLARLAVDLVRALPPLRFVGHVLTPYTALFALKQR